MLTLGAIETVVEALAKQLDAPLGLLPSFGCNYDAAQPEVRVDAAGYHFVVIERGQELQHRVFQQLEDLLQCIFEAITFSMSVDYEVNNRVPGQDFRLVLFARQIELLAQLDAAWAAQCRIAADHLLGRKP